MGDAKKKILFVHSDKTISLMYRIKFEHEGYEVKNARSGKEGLAATQEWKPDLIITELMLTEMNGLEMIEAIKQNPATQNLNIIILSGLYDADTVNRAKALGVEAYFDTQKLTPKEFAEIVKKFL